MSTHHPPNRRQVLGRSLGWALGGLQSTLAAGQAPDPTGTLTVAPGEPGPSRSWPTIRRNLFGGRPIEPGEPQVIRLDAPRRAADAGMVPVAFWIQAQSAVSRDIQKLHLIIDENPQPMAMVMHCAPGHEPVGMETRVRIESYSHVHAIAVARDGRLWESVRYVKASGGCSAAPPPDAETVAAVGRMQLRLPDVLKAGEAVVAQLVVRHPNDSGLAMDQVTRLFQPAYYLYSVAVSFLDTPVWSAELNFSISENPNFRFRFVPKQSGVLVARAIDTRGKHYESSFPVQVI